MSDTKSPRIEVSTTVEPEVAQALNTARHRDRLSKSAYIRTILVRTLRASGDLASGPSPEAGR